MASLQASTLLLCSSKRINSAIHVPKNPRRLGLSVPKLPTRKLAIEELMLRYGFTNTIPIESTETNTKEPQNNSSPLRVAAAKLYTIMEAVADRAEMHSNLAEQRNNWNTLLLNSINMMILTASTMAGLSSTGIFSSPFVAFKVSSTLLFAAATGMFMLMNKIQPSQLAEEQRNATRLFRQLQTQIETKLAFGIDNPTQMEVNETMEKVLALDRAYPLPLLGAMLEKFPAELVPAVWWPSNDHDHSLGDTKLNEQNKGKILNVMTQKKGENLNGWSEQLEGEMGEIARILKSKDEAEYVRLGNLVLKINRVMAVSGPLLSGAAALGSAFLGCGSWPVTLATTAGALAAIVCTLEHGGQMGMVLEMYRNTAGFFRLLEESIESELGESEKERRESGDMFEMKVALQLGRSLSELRDFAAHRDGGNGKDEFASKLF
ncbi:probable F-box protein At4g22030 [Malania oleifera]|uniref:probable F-box protein At4g22030 n=1 Tax=Malania oleifera TaxID=397392 RepID=UPI0025AE4656|nr:probable F-box protein At4g22030 [Malania oleifera]